MVGFAVLCVASVAVGWLLLRAVDEASSNERLSGEALILGLCLPAIASLLLSVFEIRWSVLWLAVLGAIPSVIALSKIVRHPQVVMEREVSSPTRSDLAISLPLALLTCLLLVGYAKYAWITAGAENDFIGIWGAKGRAFFEARGVDFAYLGSSWRAYAHPDYPILVPLVFSSIAMAVGDWSESLIGLTNVVFASGGLLLVFVELRRLAGSRWLAWLGVLAMMPFLLCPWIGLADGPLAVLALAALLRMRDWMERNRRSDLLIGSMFMGLAMFAKNEGIALGLVALVALALLTPRRRWRELSGVWPCAVIGLPWMVGRSFLGLTTDLFESGWPVRLVSRVLDPGYMGALVRYLVDFKPGQWGVLVVLLCATFAFRRRLSSGERFILSVVGVQMLVYLGAYVVTPLPLEWHVRWSWERLVAQVGTSFAAVAVSVLLREVCGGESSVRGDFAAAFGSSPEVEGEQADSDTDR